ncbi:unnamed protein product [Caenorhabditis auriculariae]|uniref:Uncharacterized protein n=1 Tax=Caenorhabditis auriculariae TaxID=2777116 RepID=A0A8S1HMX7_9PELO|nr:unnamed protein product [Caenorhabditis auriculariae]
MAHKIAVKPIYRSLLAEQLDLMVPMLRRESRFSYSFFSWPLCSPSFTPIPTGTILTIDNHPITTTTTITMITHDSGYPHKERHYKKKPHYRRDYSKSREYHHHRPSYHHEPSYKHYPEPSYQPHHPKPYRPEIVPYSG